MLVKLINCEPKLGKKEAFSKAQEAWKAISNCDGLHGQFGGWECKVSNAIILAIWENQSSIDCFMNEIHDQITINNNQQATFNKCAVSYFTVKMPILRIDGSNQLRVEDIGYVRIADCQLQPEGKKQFFDDQVNVWNPAMSNCNGMLGGYIAKSNLEHDRYLVVSLWENELSHHKYMENAFPLARSKVNLNSYIKRMSGYQVKVDKAWDVIPNKKIQGTK